MKLRLKKTIKNQLIIDLFNFYKNHEKEFTSFYEMSNKIAYNAYENKARLFLNSKKKILAESIMKISFLQRNLYVGFISQWKNDGGKSVFGLDSLVKVIVNILENRKPLIIDYEKPSFKFPEIKDTTPPSRSYARLFDPYI